LAEPEPFATSGYNPWKVVLLCCSRVPFRTKGGCVDPGSSPSAVTVAVSVPLWSTNWAYPVSLCLACRASEF
jgi:hypothetical protein